MGRIKGSKNKPKATVVLEIDLNPVEAILDPLEDIIVKGWVNVQTSKFRVLGKLMVGYYTAGDIHETLQEAKKAASDSTIGQAFISIPRS